MTHRPTSAVPGRLHRYLRAVRRLRGDDARHADGGFTLIEAVVSFSIFALVSGAAVLALVTGVKSNNDSTDRVTAAQVAQQATDRARALPKASLTASPSVTTTEVVGNKTYSVTRSVTYPGGGCPAPTATPTGTAVRTMVVTVRVAIPGDADRGVRVDSVLAC